MVEELIVWFNLSPPYHVWIGYILQIFLLTPGYVTDFQWSLRQAVNIYGELCRGSDFPHWFHILQSQDMQNIGITVNVAGRFTAGDSINCGVSQGSLMSPMLFTINKLPHWEITRGRSLMFCLCTDQQGNKYDRSREKSFLQDSHIFHKSNSAKYESNIRNFLQ